MRFLVGVQLALDLQVAHPTEALVRKKKSFAADSLKYFFPVLLSDKCPTMKG